MHHLNRHLFSLLLLIITATVAIAQQGIAVITTDYATYGGISRLEPEAPWTATIDEATISSDAVGRYHDGLFYIVNRGGANIQVLDPADGLSTLRQFSVGVGRNPQDIAFASSDVAYVICYDEAVLLKVDTVAGVVLDSFSTAAFADADGLPETGWLLKKNDRLYITCQRLDRNNWWVPADYALLLVFDIPTESWLDADPIASGVNGIRLSGTNPSVMPQMSTDGRSIVLGCAGGYGVADGGVEYVDWQTMQTEGFRRTGADLGGDLLDVAVCGAQTWVTISNAGYQTELLRFATSGAGGVTRVAIASGYDYSDLAWDGGDQLLLADRAPGASGVRIFDSATGVELTSSPIPTGRPPFMIMMPANPRTSDAPAAGLSIARLSAPWPNPANPRVNFSFSAEAGSIRRVIVNDLRGRLLRQWSVTVGADGRGRLSFDGTDQRGRALPSGAYRVSVVGAGKSGTRGFVLAR